MRLALEKLDAEVDQPARLVIGRGAAMILAYGHTLATQDVDAFAAKGGATVAELDAAAKRVAAELSIAPDWLNAHFTTFTHVLPADYAERARRVYDGNQIVVDALGPEDLLIMKCFAGRDKDIPHARVLLGHLTRPEVVDAQLSQLIERRIPHAQRAADFYDDLCDELDV